MTTAPRALLLDLDDTLVEEEPSAVLAFRRAAERVDGVDAGALGLATRAAGRARWHAHPAWPWAATVGVSSWEAMWCPFAAPAPPELARDADSVRTAAWVDALAAAGIRDGGAEQLARTCVAAFIEERRALNVVYPDVVPALERWRAAGVPLAIVTNGASDLQRIKLDGAGLTQFFDAVVVSADVGVAKPDPAPFLAACEALGVAPGDALMVGDSQTKDVDGARSAGLQALHLDRTRGMTLRAVEI